MSLTRFDEPPTLRDEPKEASFQDAVAHWQWALDAAAEALDADRFVLPGAELAEETKRLRQERVETAEMIRRVAAMRGTTPAPWLAPGPVTPTQLGLPAGARVCLFDLEGVLTDGDALHAAAWTETLDPLLAGLAREPDRPFVPFGAEADYRAYFEGRPRLDGLRLFLAGRGLDLPDAEVERIADRKAELVERGLRSRGVAARGGAARYLQAAGLARLTRVVVAASASTVQMIEHAGLTQLVDAVVDADVIASEGLRPLPAPDILLAACRSAGVEPEDGVALTHVGAAVVAARAAGLAVVGIASGWEAEELAAYGAPQVFGALSSLLDPRLRG